MRIFSAWTWERVIPTLIVTISLLSSVVWAQGTGYLTGYVVDPSNAAVAAATIKIQNQATGATFTVATTDAGVYRSPSLSPGAYSVTVAAKGFKTFVANNVIVSAGQPQGLNITLTIGATQEQVVVTGTAPLLKTEDSGLGQSVDFDQVSRLPYFSRSAGSLISLSPLVRYDGEDSVSYGASRYNVAGVTNVNVSVDGARVNGDREDVAQMTLNPSVESLSEVKVITNQYSAEFGQDVGSLVLMQTKSGTNLFHGGAYEYLRNEAFDANNRFSDTRPRDRENMFGGTLGGPIIKKKLLFFTSQEGFRQTSPIGVVLTVPTAAMKSGDFTGLNPIYDPATVSCTAGVCTRTQFLNNQIPTTRFDPVANNLLKYFPDPNLPGNVNNLTATTGYNNHRYRAVNKIDWNVGSNDMFTFVWMIDHVTSANLGINAYNEIDPAASPQSGYGFEYQTQVFNFTENHVFSPTVFMSNQFVYRPRYISRLNQAVDPSKKYAETLGIKNYAGELMPPDLGGDLGFPTFTLNGYSGVGPGFLLFQEAPIHEFDYNGSISFTRRSHTIKAGFQLEKGEHGAPDQSFPTGNFNFSPTETSSQNTSLTGGDPFASLLLGQVDTGATELGPRLTWKNTYFAFFVADDWKASRHLTFNFGLRWDVDLPVYEIQHRGNAFNLTKINPVSGTPGTYEFLGINGWPTNFFDTDWHRFAPRFGFAYQLPLHTVVRGGYGIYNTSPILGANRRAPSDGFTTNASFGSPDGGFTPAFILGNGFPSYPVGGSPSLLNESYGAVPVGQTPVASPNFIDRNWRMGYVQNFNLSLQHELSRSMIVEIAGLGSLGRRLPEAQDLNEVPPQFWGIPGSNYSRRPFPQFADVFNEKDTIGTTDYYGGYIRFERRFSGGSGIIANYSLSKSLGFMGGSIYDQRLSRTQTLYEEANGSYAIPNQAASISGIYSFPFGTGRRYLSSGWMSNVIGGWDLGGLLSARGGVPYDITSGGDSLNANNANYNVVNDYIYPIGSRVNLIGNPNPPHRTPAQWLNPAAFVAASFGQVGTFCCSKLYGPRNTMMNASLEKTFPIREHKIKFVAEIFNLFNSPQWGLPDATLTDPGFGTITNQYSGQGAGSANPQDGARIMQLGLRFDF